MDGIDLSDPRAGYLRVADGIRRQIEAGDLSPGDQLPTQRELAAEYGVGTETVKRALEQLRSAQLVVSHQGKGSFVGRGPATASPKSDEFGQFVSELTELRAEVAELRQRLDRIESRGF
ncbi:GntR family transcriptional regulator [Amycolatopsis echigonensis]|uniref:GntR family transcriptional regulator n=1 Tax=Amycolatopsis echigonensis TaxID=2576905 RepID=A0A8E2B6R2_9PSEU|nr:GntR family transcriptional regulator [Amycolatopsis echigonensis]MBB2501198.1 GntR family transcriptional regulator [Amycolatopsis echigonensis]